MEALAQSSSAMAMLFIIIAIGYILRKREIMNDAFDAGLTKIIMSITLPALILNSVLSNDHLPRAEIIGMILLVTCATYVLILVLSLIVPKLYPVHPIAKAAHTYTIAFGNTGFVGFAVVGAMLGEQAVLYASIYNIPYNILMFSFGIWVMARVSGDGEKLNTKEMLKSIFNPATIACLIALGLALAHISDVGGIIGRTCNIVGSMTAPASMLIVGSTLAKFKPREMVVNPWAYVSTALRLLVAPAIVVLIGGLMVEDPLLLATLGIVAGTPVATMGIIMCIRYKGDLRTMSQCTFLTTVISVLTIPLIAVFVL